MKRFIYASTSSVYGVKEEAEVTEDLSLEPLTDYSKYKAICEDVLLKAASNTFIVSIIRPATVCGYSPRLRLDLIVNILVNDAINKGKIIVFGGEQKRPNIHIEDITDLYVYLLELPDEKIHRKIFNAGYENYSAMEIAEKVLSLIGSQLSIKVLPTNDNRSYRISSEKTKRELGFTSKHTIEEAILDLKRAFNDGKILDPLNDIKYYNIKTMLSVKLK